MLIKPQICQRSKFGATEPEKQYSTSSFKGYHDIGFPRAYPNEVQRDGGAPSTQGHLHSLVHLSRTHGRCVLRDSGQRESRYVCFSDCSQTDRRRDCPGCLQTTGPGIHGTVIFFYPESVVLALLCNIPDCLLSNSTLQRDLERRDSQPWTFEWLVLIVIYLRVCYLNSLSKASEISPGLGSGL